MRQRARDQQGFTLIELLVAATMMLIILGATLTLFTDFTNANRRNELQNDAQDRARLGTDQLARDLRNLASPTNELPQAVDKAGPYDLVFKEADPVWPPGTQNSWNIRRMRYCLDSSNANDARLWAQIQTWTTATDPGMPSTSSCPAAAWPTKRLVADKLVNRIASQDRPAFTYTGGGALADITGVRTSLFVDVNPGKSPAETHLASGVFLRNQNRFPHAEFSASPKPGAIVLNGSASQDPEGDDLKYDWYVNGAKVGSGVTFIYTVPGTGTRTVSVQLKVYDPAGLEGVSATQAVTVS
jgi:prepilin-type N-terminal cleavage/methylation domain-containing protein